MNAKEIVFDAVEQIEKRAEVAEARVKTFENYTKALEAKVTRLEKELAEQNAKFLADHPMPNPAPPAEHVFSHCTSGIFLFDDESECHLWKQAKADARQRLARIEAAAILDGKIAQAVPTAMPSPAPEPAQRDIFTDPRGYAYSGKEVPLKHLPLNFYRELPEDISDIRRVEDAAEKGGAA